VRSINDVSQIEVHTAQPLVPANSPFEVDIAIVKFYKSKSSDSDVIPTEVIQARDETSTNLLILFGIRRN
jgi:hypothetical protein